MMVRSRRFWMLTHLFVACFIASASGQSLSLVKKGGGGFSIEGAAPPSPRYALQGSANLRLWVDLNDSLAGQWSYPFDPTGASQRYYRLVEWVEPASPIKLVLVGDSTVADLELNQGAYNGWGQGVYGYVKSDYVKVVNLAWQGLSSSFFLTSDQYSRMLAIKPDYVLIQFGLIEFKTPVTAPTGVTFEQYAENLKTIVRSVRGFNGTAILVTPPPERIFDAAGQVRIEPAFQQRCDTMKEVAVETGTPLIDLNQLSLDLFNKLGESGLRVSRLGMAGRCEPLFGQGRESHRRSGAERSAGPAGTVFDGDSRSPAETVAAANAPARSGSRTWGRRHTGALSPR